MLYVIAGMPRSGSTFTFNIVKDALKTKGAIRHAADQSILPYLTETDDFVVKAHELDEASIALIRSGAATLISTIRNPEDAIASWIETFGVEMNAAVDTVLAWLDLHKRLAGHSLTIDYDDIEYRPRETAGIIARHVVPNIHPLRLAAIWRRHAKTNVLKMVESMDRANPDVLDLGFSFAQSETFYHRRHVTQVGEKHAADRLSPHDLAHIRWRLEVAGYSNVPDPDFPDEAQVAAG